MDPNVGPAMPKRCPKVSKGAHLVPKGCSKGGQGFPRVPTWCAKAAQRVAKGAPAVPLGAQRVPKVCPRGNCAASLYQGGLLKNTLYGLPPPPNPPIQPQLALCISYSCRIITHAVWKVALPGPRSHMGLLYGPLFPWSWGTRRSSSPVFPGSLIRLPVVAPRCATSESLSHAADPLYAQTSQNLPEPPEPPKPSKPS